MRRLAPSLAGLLLACGPTPTPPAAATPAPTAVTPTVATASPTSAPPTPTAATPAQPAANATTPTTPVATPVATDTPCVVDLASATTLRDKIDRVRSTCGDGLYDADATLLAPLTPTRGRYLQFFTQGDAHHLYFFAHDAPRLLRLDLVTGDEREVVKLPRLKQPCFDRNADPISHIQSPADLHLDPAGNLLCLDLKDRNENMMSIAVNLKVDLTTRKVEQRVTAVIDCHDAPGDLKEQPPACSAYQLNTPPTPDDAPEIAEHTVGRSPSGRWRYTFGEALPGGDYQYALPMLEAGAQSFAITRTRLVPYKEPGPDDPSRPMPVPDGVCQLAAEYSATWLPRTDVLLLPFCGADLLLVRPPGRFTPVTADAYVALP